MLDGYPRDAKADPTKPYVLWPGTQYEHLMLPVRRGSQLLRGFVEAHERALRIVRSLIDFQDVFHGGDKRRVGVGPNHPLLLAMRLENVFELAFCLPPLS